MMLHLLTNYRCLLCICIGKEYARFKIASILLKFLFFHKYLYLSNLSLSLLFENHMFS